MIPKYANQSFITSYSEVNCLFDIYLCYSF